MMEFREMKDVVGVSGLTHDRQASDLAARIELQTQGLQHTRFDAPVHESDGEGHQAVYAGSPSFQEQARPLLAAGHQGMFRPIEHKDGHRIFFLSVSSPYGAGTGAPEGSLLSTRLATGDVRSRPFRV
jgi:hypothetical protein